MVSKYSSGEAIYPFQRFDLWQGGIQCGRYLDLEPESDLIPGGKWDIDFNRAYNPWCVRSKDCTCPLVPPENWLEVAIPAGEKNYPLKKE